MTTPDPTVFERCVESATDVMLADPDPSATAITRAVLTALRDHTGSPYTVDEVTRVLGE